jgi:hypothetical protein
VKTKAYKLAVELGVQEASLLEWLRKPHARRSVAAVGRDGGLSRAHGSIAAVPIGVRAGRPTSPRRSRACA